MHDKRRLLMAVVASGGMAVGLGTFAGPASAIQRTFEVQLLGKIKKTIVIDVGADTPLDQIRLPQIGGLPILSIKEITPVNAPPSNRPSLSIKPTVPAQAPAPAPAAPAAEQPTVPLQADVREPAVKKGTKKTRAKAGKELDTAGRLLDKARLPETARPKSTNLRLANGIPTLSNPTLSLALPGAVPVGVPNFFINKFAIPPFLLSIYQAAGIQYGIRWEVLAAINEIETDYGRNLNVSSAGAMGWMQFIPSSWKAWGVDANADGKKDPYNPVDAVFSAARYLKAAGADQDLRKAIFAYNHADWYV
ncbi:MAG: lytic transglycosylase domain-containing protein, partial [Actinobacteria bacterium]|nr:lytic transglycosylase domain-containing protein [Actinomycetota bacterium]